jgi:hypothetical protein
MSNVRRHENMADTFNVDVDSKLRPTHVLRRYLDLPKYVDLLRSRSLYFRRADRFPDRFEGALTPSIRRLINYPGVGGPNGEDADGYYRHAREGGFVSCWSRGARDNMALWQLYGGVKSSLVITTTVEKLAEVASTWPDITSIHKVRYIDHFKNPPMTVGHYTDVLECKHEAYSYENEVRVIVSRHRGDWTKNPIDFRLPVPNLNAFIRSIVVAPEADDWYFEAIQEVTRRFELSVPVRRSQLTMLPT